jgi:hypothetical protein
VAAWGLAVNLVTAADPTSSADVQEAATDRAAATFTRVCGDCHDLETVTTTRRYREQWEEVTVEMIAEGARVTDDEYVVVIDYLVKHHGRVGVNRAEVAGLVEVLGISEADAGRIVAHRKAHGPFADFEALIKVPGVDVEKLTAQRNLMTF